MAKRLEKQTEELRVAYDLLLELDSDFPSYVANYVRSYFIEKDTHG